MMSDDDEVFVFGFDEDVEWTDAEVQAYLGEIGDLEGCHEQ